MEKIKFAVFTDLHYEHIPDGERRLKKFIDEVEQKNVDFIMNLGDFCVPENDKGFLIDILNSINKPVYNIIGNHDSDKFPKSKYLEFFNMKNAYYSFVIDKFKFICLDTCFIKNENGYEAYSKNKHKDTSGNYPILPEDQVKWLKEELSDDNKYYVIFSHHSFENNFAKRGVYNREEVRKIIDEANINKKKVLLCVNGHDHGDSIEKIGKTIYFGLNAMSYIWVGPEYEHFCYSKEIHNRYPYIKDMILYKNGLYTMVTITKDGEVEIEGMEDEYDNVTPIELNVGDTWNGRSILPKVSSYKSDKQ